MDELYDIDSVLDEYWDDDEESWWDESYERLAEEESWDDDYAWFEEAM